MGPPRGRPVEDPRPSRTGRRRVCGQVVEWPKAGALRRAVDGFREGAVICTAGAVGATGERIRGVLREANLTKCLPRNAWSVPVYVR